MSEASTEALAISPTPEGLADFKADGRWRKLERTEVIRQITLSLQ